MRCVCVLSAALLLAGAVPATAINDNAGTTGFSFLKICVGARPAAMGGAGTALAADADAPAWNPAGLFGLERRTGTLAVADYLLDAQAGYASVALPGARRAWALSVVYLAHGDLQKTSETGADLGTFSAADVAAFVTCARPVWRDWLTAGLNLKMVYSTIDTYSADAYMVDAGLLLRTPAQGLTAGVSLSNVGTVRSSYAGFDDSLPVGIRLGAAYRPAHMPLPVLLVADLNIPNDGDPFTAFGAEVRCPGGLYLRPGYSTQRSGVEGDQALGLGGGMGLAVRGYRVDYAYSSYPDLGDVHRLAVSGGF